MRDLRLNRPSSDKRQQPGICGEKPRKLAAGKKKGEISQIRDIGKGKPRKTRLSDRVSGQCEFTDMDGMYLHVQQEYLVPRQDEGRLGFSLGYLMCCDLVARLPPARIESQNETRDAPGRMGRLIAEVPAPRPDVANFPFLFLPQPGQGRGGEGRGGDEKSHRHLQNPDSECGYTVWTVE